MAAPGLYADRVVETTATTGTGTLTLGGALAPFYQTFNAAFPSPHYVNYTIYGGSDWEVGQGVFTSPTSLSRLTVFASSNADALVSLAAVSHVVFCDLPAAMMLDIGMGMLVQTLAIPQ